MHLSVLRHHFKSQRVAMIHDSSNVTAYSQNDKLFVALNNYVIQVRDLNLETDECHSFPCVDKIEYMLHNMAGNYLVTIECIKKLKLKTVRVYTNWDKVHLTKGEKFPFGTRFAAVPESPQRQFHHEFLDIIEIPLSYPDLTCINCCQIDGKLLIICGFILTIYDMEYCSSERHGHCHYYLDFIKRQHIYVVSGFNPLGLNIVDNVVCVYDAINICTFEILKSFQEHIRSKPDSDFKTLPDSDFKTFENSSLNQCSSKDNLDNFESWFDVKEIKLDDGAYSLGNMMELCLNKKSKEYLQKFTNYPVIMRLSGVNDDCLTMRDTNQVKVPWCESINVVAKSDRPSVSVDRSVDVEIILKLRAEVPVQKWLKVLHVPIFEKCYSDDDSKVIRAHVCFFISVQLGHLYYIGKDHKGRDAVVYIATYYFPSPVKDICMNECFVYVLTGKGLETYNNPIKEYEMFGKNPECLLLNDTIACLGVYPFMNPTQMSISINYVVILTKPGKNSNVTATLYSIALPSLKDVLADAVTDYSNWSNNSFISDWDKIKERRYYLAEICGITYAMLEYDFPTGVENGKVDNQPYTIDGRFQLKASFYYTCGSRERDWQRSYMYFLRTKASIMEFVTYFLYKKSKWWREGGVEIPSTGVIWLVNRHLETTIEELERKSIAGKLLEFCDRGDGNLTKDVTIVVQMMLRNNLYCFEDSHADILSKFRRNTVLEDHSGLLGICYVYLHARENAKLILNEMLERGRNLIIEGLTIYTHILFNEIGNEYEYSDLSKFLMQNAPAELAEALARLSFENSEKFNPLFLVKNLIGQAVVIFLENAFQRCSGLHHNQSSKLILMLAEAYVKEINTIEFCDTEQEYWGGENYQPIFCDGFPEFITLLPPLKLNYYQKTRRLQDLLCLQGTRCQELAHSLQAVLLNLPDYLRSHVLPLIIADATEEFIRPGFFNTLLSYSKKYGNDFEKWSTLDFKLTKYLAENKEYLDQKDKDVMNQLFTIIMFHKEHSSVPIEETFAKKQKESIVKEEKEKNLKIVRKLVSKTCQDLLPCLIDVNSATTAGEDEFNNKKGSELNLINSFY